MIALLCSGQGHQHSDMFRLTRDQPAAAEIFAAAAAALGEDVQRFTATTDTAALQANRAAQILCVTQAVALRAVLGATVPPRHLVAGYSVGALAAWSLAGCVDAPAAVALAARRADAMDLASGPDDGLAFVRGLPMDITIQEAGAHGVAVAIVNPGGLQVVGGPRAALYDFCAAMLDRGAARARLLPVRVASHTPALASAVAPFAAALRSVDTRPPKMGITLMTGANGAAVRGGGGDWLAAQIAVPLDWAACMDGLVERGMHAALELGPGRALADMVAGIAPDLPVRSADDFASIDGLAGWLARFG